MPRRHLTSSANQIEGQAYLSILIAGVFLALSLLPLWAIATPSLPTLHLIEELKQIEKDSPQSCDFIMANLSERIHQDHYFFNAKPAISDARNFIEQSSVFRFHLRNRFLLLRNEQCSRKLLEVIHDLRDREDYTAEYAGFNQPLDPSKIDFSKIDIPLKEMQNYEPYQTSQGLSKAPIVFQNGDLMLTRGFSYVSASISQSSSNKSQFSHLVFVSKDPRTQDFSTIESYVGAGVDRFTLDSALRNENARIQLYRFPDQDTADRASQWINNKIKGPKIPYDYAQNFSDESRLTCHEIPYHSFEHATNGDVMLPEFPAENQIGNPNILKLLGVKNGPTFSPDDLEIDARFELLLEWTDYRILRDHRYKNMITRKIFEWANTRSYNLRNSTASFIAGNILYPLRRVDLIWKLVKKIPSIKEFPKDLPRNMLMGMLKIQNVGDILYDVLKTADKVSLRRTGRPLNNEELLETLENYRLEDLKKYENRWKLRFRPAEEQSHLHRYFRP